MVKEKLKRKNLFFIFCLIIIVIQFCQVIFLKQNYFTQKYDQVYWKDRIEHSQWNLPKSSRGIGDDGLYSWSGLLLAKGEPPTGLNTETPPLGKYLIGYSILFFGTSGYYALIFAIATSLLFYLLLKRVFKNRELAIFITAAFCIDPLYFSQFWNAFIDLPQLFFLLLNLYLLSIVLKKSSMVLVIGAGISLGFFAETKTPILFPVIFLLESIYLYLIKKRIEIAILIASSIVGILFVYLQFFLTGGGIIAFMKLQKFIFEFFLKSDLETHTGAIWQVLFMGRFQELTGSSLIKVGEWTIAWPIVTIMGIISAVKALIKRKRDLFLCLLALVMLSGLIVYTFIPSYPRYLLLILPFLYLFTGLAISKYITSFKVKILFGALLIFGLVSSNLYLKAVPTDVLNPFSHSFSHGYFKDIAVENIEKKSLKITPNQFDILSKKVLSDAQVKSIEVKNIETNASKFDSTGKAKMTVIYKTQNLGEFAEVKELNLVKQNNEWNVVWDWDIILSDFKPGYKVETNILEGSRGTIYKEGIVSAEDREGYLISVNPKLISKEKEDELLTLLAAVSGKTKVDIHNAYSENIIPGTFIPITTTFSEFDPKILENYSGIKIEPHRTRIYSSIAPDTIDNSFYAECCTRIYSPHNYHGISGAEKEFDKKLSGWDGGSLKIYDEKGKLVRTIIDKKPKYGSDVYLDK